MSFRILRKDFLPPTKTLTSLYRVLLKNLSPGDERTSFSALA